MKSWFFLIATLLVFACSNNEQKLSDTFELGDTENGVYRNDYFNLTIQAPPSWVALNRAEIRELMGGVVDKTLEENESMEGIIKTDQANSAHLLAFSRAGDRPNGSLFVTAQNAAMTGFIKTAKQYQESSLPMLKLMRPNYSYNKAIYQSNLGGVESYVLETYETTPGSNQKQENHVILLRDYFLLFVLTYNDESGKEELYKMLDTIEF